LDLDALAESSPHSDIIHPQYITRLVSELTAEDAIFTCDGGAPIIWTALPQGQRLAAHCRVVQSRIDG
jgi:thiamine pyrophosphate-dependent acetolactate synthase large subunit-like protein